MFRRCGRGFSRFEFAIAVIVIALLALPLIATLLRYQGTVERQQMENDVRDMQTFLNLKLLNLMLSHRQVDIDRLAGSNPVELLERAPGRYLGERDNAPGKEESGWYFDRQRHELVYLPASFSFPYRAGGAEVLRWQLQRIKGSEMSVRLVTLSQKPALPGES